MWTHTHTHTHTHADPQTHVNMYHGRTGGFLMLTNNNNNKPMCSGDACTPCVISIWLCLFTIGLSFAYGLQFSSDFQIFLD